MIDAIAGKDAMELEAAIQRAVKKLEGEDVDAFEVVGISDESLVVEAKRQKVDSFRRATRRGVSIRVVRDGRMGWSSTTDIGLKAIGKMVKEAMAAMGVAAKTEEAVIAKPQEPRGGFAEQLGRSFGEIPDDEKMRMALRLESAAIASDSRVRGVRGARYEESIHWLNVVNSNGISTGSRRGLVLCELKAVAADGGDSESASEFDFSPRFEDLDVEGVARRAAARAVAKLGAGRIERGRMPVVFENRAASSMVGVLAPSFFADNVQRGKSTLAGRMGERAYSGLVTVVDDGLLPGGFNSFPFDGEGIPTGRTTLIRDGCVSAWLYDGPRAKRDGVLSTGNCRRVGLNKLPSIDVTNCFLERGGTALSQLIAGIERGFFVTDLLGVHMSNSISGDFSLGAEGFLIEGGRLDVPVRGVTVAGNVHDVFGRVGGLGDDLRFFGRFGSPSVLVDGVMIGG